MLKDEFVNIVKTAVKATFEIDADFVCEKPKNPDFGDFAVNVSSLSRELKKAPPVIAQEIAANIMATPFLCARSKKSEQASLFTRSLIISPKNFEVTVVAGFINFKVQENVLFEVIKEILEKGKTFGSSDLGRGKRVNIEYVSANPTGPFHIGHGRWAAVGSALANVLRFSGYDVFEEFYINDAGAQIGKLGKSLELRVKEQKGEKVEYPEDWYPGEYLVECAKKYISEGSDEDYASYAKREMLNLQKALLERFRTHFDLFFSETSLYENDEVDECVKKLEKSGKLYEKEGALWFRSTDFGDEKDRVLKKANGDNTYLTADIAYHYNKFERGFDTLINIWGADHHGYIARVKAAMEALGKDSTRLEVLLGQLVNIIQDGEAVRMGKRKKMVTLDELIDEVGVDATRFWMLMRSIDTTLDFDIDLAKSQSDQNPVFYVQYAHARCCSILRRALEVRLDTETGCEIDPYLAGAEFESYLKNPLFVRLCENSCESVKRLVLKLEEFKAIVESAVRLRAPYLLCKYVMELAGDFHHFYNFNRVLSDDKEATLSRLCVVESVRSVMKNALDLIGVEAVEKM